MERVIESAGYTVHYQPPLWGDIRGKSEIDILESLAARILLVVVDDEEIDVDSIPLEALAQIVNDMLAGGVSKKASRTSGEPRRIRTSR